MTDAIFAALADPVRRAALARLAGGEQAAGELVGDLTARFGISQPAVSQHLRVLRDCGLVTVRPEGNRRLYRLGVTGVDSVIGWLSALREIPDPFAQSLDALETEVARGRRDRRRVEPDEAPDRQSAG